MIVIRVCPFCTHYQSRSKCAAFSEATGIPSDILLNKHNHRLEYPDDGGYRFDPKPDAPEWITEVWPE